MIESKVKSTELRTSKEKHVVSLFSASRKNSEVEALLPAEGIAIELTAPLVDPARTTCFTAEDLDPTQGLNTGMDEGVMPSPVPSKTVEVALGLAQTAEGSAFNAAIPTPEGPVTIAVGQLVGNRYILESLLGAGGMGSVFKARDLSLNDLPERKQYVALKVLRGDITQRAGAWTSLRREFVYAQQLSHQNIVKVYEIYQENDVYFFTMELLQGETLTELLRRPRSNPFAREAAYRIIRSIGAGLEHSHKRGIVHADLKPQNVFITGAGEVRLLDWGAAARWNGAPTDKWGPSETRRTAVTPAYASRDSMSGSTPTPRDDVYALACISYELLAGLHPFERQSAIDAQSRNLDPQRPPNISERQWQLVSSALAWTGEEQGLTIREWADQFSVSDAAVLNRRERHSVWGVDTKISRLVAASAIAILLIIVMLYGGGLLTQTPTEGRHSALIRTTPSGHEPFVPVSASPQSNYIVSSNWKGSAKVPVAAEKATDRTAFPIQHEPHTFPRRTRMILQAAPGDDRIMSFTAQTVRTTGNFAEIRILRSGSTDQEASVNWRTESVSAEEGEDYLPQKLAKQFFGKGRRIASVFVKVLRIHRTQQRVFRVVISDPSEGYLLPSSAKVVVQIGPG